MRSRLTHWPHFALLACLIGALSLTGKAFGDPNVPEDVLRDFYAAFNAKDLKKMASFVQGVTVTPALEALEMEIRAPGQDEMTLTIKSISVDVKGKEAVAKGMLTATIKVDPANLPKGKQPPAVPDQPFTQSMRLTDTGWKVVPPTREEIAAMMSRQGGQSAAPPVAMLVVIPDVLLASRAAARRAGCLSTLRLLANSALIYGLDWEKWDFTPTNLQKKLMVHVKDPERFHCPVVKTENYTFNARLTGRFQDTVREPDRTVLFYEGKNGVLNFNHDGLATVAFVSGEAVALNREDAKRLKWLP